MDLAKANNGGGPFSRGVADFRKRFLRSTQPASVLRVGASTNPIGRRVLILSASAGTGHVRAAEALEKVFRQQPDVRRGAQRGRTALHQPPLPRFLFKALYPARAAGADHPRHRL
ncbi:MAG: hypothetical protein WDO13_04325 [Verrucomicrobiota bacterium]